MNLYIVGVILPILATFIFRTNHPKRRGVPITDTSDESGVTIRNRRFDSPVETAWEGVSTLAELFEEACRKHGERFLLGTRLIISKETETSSDGRRFEKVEFGDYEWLSYADAFEDVLRFGSGLAALGHERNERAAIFADTREEWFLALQVRYHYCYSIICFF
jgi:long-chain acyl-CoA synthetase